MPTPKTQEEKDAFKAKMAAAKAAKKAARVASGAPVVVRQEPKKRGRPAKPAAADTAKPKDDDGEWLL